MVRMVRMVRSLADRTFQLWRRQGAGAGAGEHRLLHGVHGSTDLGCDLAQGTEGGARVSKIGKLMQNLIVKFCKFLAGSFLAVSKRNSARKYAFDSIFQALQDLHTFAPLQSQNFSEEIGLT